MKKVLWFIVIITVILLGLTMCGESDRPSTKEVAKDNVEPEKVIQVTADALLKAYKENEVAANQLYKDKILEVSGKIQDIQAGVGDVPFISLKAGGDFEFNSPLAHFESSEKEKIISLKKGQAIKLRCIGDGEIAGSPKLDDCIIL